MRTLLPLVNSDNFLFPEDVWGTFFGDVVGSRPTLRVPKIDLEDKGDHYELQADLPGIAKEDIVPMMTRFSLFLQNIRMNRSRKTVKGTTFIMNADLRVFHGGSSFPMWIRVRSTLPSATAY